MSKSTPAQGQLWPWEMKVRRSTQHRRAVRCSCWASTVEAVRRQSTSLRKERQGLALKIQKFQGPFRAEREEASRQTQESLAPAQELIPALRLSANRRWIWQGARGNAAQLAKTDGARLPLEQPIHLLFGLLPWRHEGSTSKTALGGLPSP